jgi:hypothetical protein
VKRLTGVAYTNLDAFRRREGGVVESFDVTDDEGHRAAARERPGTGSPAGRRR